MIPKVLHYCWFGGGEKPPLIQRCLASWPEIMPDYEIREWNETNFSINMVDQTRVAFARKRWAFITDVVRLWVLRQHGGIYMDADVEVLKRFDKFLHHRAFTGHETPDLMVTATMGAERGHPWIDRLLGHYQTAQYSETPNTKIITEISKPLIEVKTNTGFKYLRDGVVIYPVEVFCPFDHTNLRPTPTDATHALHHFAGSWTPRGKTLKPTKGGI